VRSAPALLVGGALSRFVAGLAVGAGALLVSLPAMVLFLVLNRCLIGGLTLGSVKG